jgi:hypothetical protein
MSEEININVDDIIFDRLRRDDYIRMRQRGMSIVNIADSFDRSKHNVRSSVKAWGLLEWEPGQPVPEQPKKQTQNKDNVPIQSDNNKDHFPDVNKMVEHPPHYTAGKVECIDAIESAVEGLTPQEAIQVGNIMKYIWRFKRKNGKQDLHKAAWYLARLTEMQDE